MARDGATALHFVEDLHTRVRKAFAREGRSWSGSPRNARAGRPGRLAPWEIGYRAEKLRRRSATALDEEALRPYFPLERVIAGLFEVVRRTFGVQAVERPAGAAEVWHPGGEVLRAARREGPGGTSAVRCRSLASARVARGGAWMNYLLTGEPQADDRLPPHLRADLRNLTPPAGDKPALLTHREVETIPSTSSATCCTTCSARCRTSRPTV